MANPCLCTDQACMLQALLASVISQDTYNEWVFNYFGLLPIAPPQPFDSNQVVFKELTNPAVDCTWFVEVVASPLQADNNDITFAVTPTAVAAPNAIYFTLTLFNALYEIIHPVMPIATFAFTKAAQPAPVQGQSPVFDIIFQIIFTDASLPPLSWDLSSSIPPGDSIVYEKNKK